MANGYEWTDLLLAVHVCFFVYGANDLFHGWVDMILADFLRKVGASEYLHYGLIHTC